MTPLKTSEALLRSIDNILETHAKDNPELLEDLQKLRAKLEEALRARHWLDFARIALQISIWVKYLYDHLPPHG